MKQLAIITSLWIAYGTQIAAYASECARTLRRAEADCPARLAVEPVQAGEVNDLILAHRNTVRRLQTVSPFALSCTSLVEDCARICQAEAQSPLVGIPPAEVARIREIHLEGVRACGHSGHLTNISRRLQQQSQSLLSLSVGLEQRIAALGTTSAQDYLAQIKPLISPRTEVIYGLVETPRIPAGAETEWDRSGRRSNFGETAYGVQVRIPFGTGGRR